MQHNYSVSIDQTSISCITYRTNLSVEPGGYLQWEEADLGNLIVQGPAAQKFYGVAKNLFQILQFDFR